MTYLERYFNGAYEEVWNELVALGAEVRQEPLFADALAVARETMRRVRLNIETLIERLLEIGFIFGYDMRIQPAHGKPFTLENRQDYLELFAWAREQYPVFFAATQVEEEEARYGSADLFSLEVEGVTTREELEQMRGPLEPDTLFLTSVPVQELERQFGTLPLSIRAWYELVGGVNFYGYHPEWQKLCIPLVRDEDVRYGLPTLMVECDPFQICPCDALLMKKLSKKRVFGEQRQFTFAADRYFKDAYAGAGSPYAFFFPNAAMDIRLGDDRSTFVHYVRNSLLSWGGFPGMASWAVVPEKDLAFLTHNLVLF